MKLHIKYYGWLCIIACLYGLGLTKVNAQQDTQYTQYMYATNVINPAYVGSRDVLSVTSQYRAQWLGLEGAPTTFNITSNGPMNEYTFPNVGLGVTFARDAIGPSNESTVAGDFSYKLEVGRYSNLVFGIKGGLKLINVDFTKLDIYNTTDPVFQNNIDNRLSPIVGAGVYMYNENWYAGLSVPNLLTTTYYDDTTFSTARERMTFYAMGGYVFYFNDDLKFKPTFLGKFTSGAPVVLDISGNFLFNDKFTLGANYRINGNSVSGILGFQASKNILLGYSYDLDTSSIGNYSSGSHGIFLRFDVGSKRDLKYLTPRFF